jgi:hypothetical protein
MNKLAGFFCFLILAVPALAVEGNQVIYVGGSATGVVAGTLGNLDMTTENVLIFQSAASQSAAGKIEIPYAAIQSFEYSTEVSHHLGVMPAIAVGLVKKRQRRHFFRISYRDQKGVAQVAVFEVPKGMPRTLKAILQDRSPHQSAAKSPGFNAQSMNRCPAPGILAAP